MKIGRILFELKIPKVEGKPLNPVSPTCMRESVNHLHAPIFKSILSIHNLAPENNLVEKIIQ